MTASTLNVSLRPRAAEAPPREETEPPKSLKPSGPEGQPAAAGPAREFHQPSNGAPRPSTPNFSNERAPDGKPGRVRESAKNAAVFYLEHHTHAVLYGVLGFIAAVLILVIGFWPTALLALFAAAGVVMGRYRDGDMQLRERVRAFVERIS